MAAREPPLYYIETDGEVYLEEREGLLRFPERVEGLPFSVEERFRFPALGRTVVFCKPLLARHPRDWHFKDGLAERDDVDPVVRKAVNLSLPRCVVGLAIRREGAQGTEVLLVKSSRGVTEGKWNIPGGFLDFREAPEEAARREAKEELGVDVAVGRLVGAWSEHFPGSGHQLYCFVYEVEPEHHRFAPGPDEIAEIAWFPIAKAIEATANPFAKAAFRALLRPGSPRSAGGAPEPAGATAPPGAGGRPGPHASGSLASGHQKR